MDINTYSYSNGILTVFEAGSDICRSACKLINEPFTLVYLTYDNISTINNWYPDNCKHVFAVNSKRSDKITPIPIGVCLGFSPCTENIDKDILCSRVYRYTGFRINLDIIFDNMEFITKFNPCPTEEYARILKRSIFTLSPKGSGYDSFRTWEALESDCIPIVESMEEIDDFTEYGIMYIDSFKNLTKDMLIDFLKNNRPEIYEKYLDKIF